MKKYFKRIILAALVSASFCLPLFSADAKVTYVKGKVEISRNGGDWTPLKPGDSVAQSDTINTGFQSEARINLNGSIMAVPALTRVTLETLKTSDSKDSVSLYVNTGAVRSKVTHTDNKKIDYTARTAVAVASVRGTDFTITAGGKVSCLEGAVAVMSAKDYVPPAQEDEAVEEESEEEGDEGSESSGNDLNIADESTGDEDSSDSSGDAAEVADSSVTSESGSVPESSAGNDTVAGSDNTSASDNVSVSDNASVADNSGNRDSSDNKRASSTTPAKDISNTTSDNSVVVGAGQTTSFTTSGNPEKPKTTTEKKTEKTKNTVNTNAEKDATSSGGTKTDTVSTEPPKPTTGTVVVSITLED